MDEIKPFGEITDVTHKARYDSLKLMQDVNDLFAFFYKKNVKCVLGGSRKYLPKEPHDVLNSDYDLILQYSEEFDECVDELREVYGFHAVYAEVTSEVYYDANTRRVYKSHEVCPFIDIVVKHNLEMHEFIMSFVTPEFYKEHLWKSNPHGKNNYHTIQNIINDLYATAMNYEPNQLITAEKKPRNWYPS